MANDVAPKATMSLYASFWKNKGKQSAILLSLKELAEGFEKPLTAGMVRLYTAVLAEMTQEQIVLAFSRATDECKFFPAPALLRDFSGLAVSGDPIATEAKDKLFYLIAGMRSAHGHMLRPIPGRVIYGTEDDPRDKDGRTAAAPIREASTEFPLDRRLKAALVRLGWGDSTKGIAVIADHPALQRKADREDGQYRQNQLRAADEILKRFTDCYREA
jgi:hypothetical protein